MPNEGNDTQQTFQVNDLRQLLVLVRYKPAGMMAADDMLGGVTSAVDGAVSAVENAAAAIPGLSLFFKEEQEPEKKSDKEYNYYKDYKEWDAYAKKMKPELSDKLFVDNDVIVHDFDADDENGIKSEGKALLGKVKAATASWAGNKAYFHFVGIGHGGNVANVCIDELSKESDFSKEWYVKSVVYIGASLYKNKLGFDEEKAFRGLGKATLFVNNYDLTQQVIQYFQPSKDLLSMIAESNSNPVSLFTGNIKKQIVTTLGRLLTIKSFGTDSDNEGNIKKITDCKDDIKGLVSECCDAAKALFDAVPGLVKPGDLPDFSEGLNGFSAVPDKAMQRFKKLEDELAKIRQGTSLDTKNFKLAKVFNVFCPLFDQVALLLSKLSYSEPTLEKIAEEMIDKAGIKKVWAPKNVPAQSLPVDPYIEQAIIMIQQAEAAKQEGGSSEQTAVIDQSISMINTAKQALIAATKDGDLDMQNAGKEQKLKIAEAIAVMLLPMMPNKGKFYATLLNYLPLGGLNSFLQNITADAAMNPLKSLMSNVQGGFEFDRGTPEEPGLQTSIDNLNKELARIKGFFNKNNYPVHKDANSLYFIYNSHNVLLKKPYGKVLFTIDSELGYADYMGNNGFTNHNNLEKNWYEANAGQTPRTDVQPAVAINEKTDG